MTTRVVTLLGCRRLCCVFSSAVCLAAALSLPIFPACLFQLSCPHPSPLSPTHLLPCSLPCSLPGIFSCPHPSLLSSALLLHCSLPCSLPYSLPYSLPWDLTCPRIKQITLNLRKQYAAQNVVTIFATLCPQSLEALDTSLPPSR